MPWRKQLGNFLVRLSVIFIVTGALLFLPAPLDGDVLHYKNALVALVSVISIGKLLLDTLFYDRYQR